MSRPDDDSSPVVHPTRAVPADADATVEWRAAPTTLTLDGLELRWGAITDTGKVRKLNEDSMLAAPGVFVVADGMGGHAAGDVASRLTVETFSDIVTGSPLDLSVIAAVVSDANDRVRAYANDHDHAGMGSTVVGALLVDNAGENSIVVFNVGDTRCYVLVDHRLSQLTCDHSLVQEMVDSGEIDAAGARVHPQRNVVTRAIGIEASVAADFVVAPTGTTRLLLCSDGVHGEISDAQIAALLALPDDPTTVARAVIDEVLRGRAADNATAMVVDVIRTLRPQPDDDIDDIDATGPRPPTDVRQDAVPVMARAVEVEETWGEGLTPPPDLIVEIPQAVDRSFDEPDPGTLIDTVPT